MAKKSFFRRVGEFLRIVKPKETPEPAPATTPKPVHAPSKPVIPPHPRQAPGSKLSIEDRVALYKSLSPARRRAMRPQDEEREYWNMYDQGEG